MDWMDGMGGWWRSGIGEMVMLLLVLLGLEIQNTTTVYRDLYRFIKTACLCVWLYVCLVVCVFVCVCVCQ